MQSLHYLWSLNFYCILVCFIWIITDFFEFFKVGISKEIWNKFSERRVHNLKNLWSKEIVATLSKNSSFNFKFLRNIFFINIYFIASNIFHFCDVHLLSVLLLISCGPISYDGHCLLRNENKMILTPVFINFNAIFHLSFHAPLCASDAPHGRLHAYVHGHHDDVIPSYDFPSC